MSQTASKSKTRVSPEPPTSFDVVSVLGTVHMDKHGTENPMLAAFRLIAEHDAPGEFTFPNLYGGETRVNVEPAPQYRGNADDDGYGS